MAKDGRAFLKGDMVEFSDGQWGTIYAGMGKKRRYVWASISNATTKQNRRIPKECLEMVSRRGYDGDAGNNEDEEYPGCYAC